MFYAKKVDTRSKKAMIEFLTGHFRYDTMSGWKAASSYANRIKINNLGLTAQQVDAAFEMLDIDFWNEIDWPIHDFTSEMYGEYTIGKNGRSGGYLVLYESQYKLTGHQSYCRSCGQQNYKRVYEPASSADKAFIEAYVFRNNGCWVDSTYLAESEIAAIKLADNEKLDIIRTAKKACKESTLGNKCGKCGASDKNGRVNYTTPPKILSVLGRSIDRGEDFSDYEEWTLSKLRTRVELVQKFDQACDKIRNNFIDLLDNCKVVEDVVMVPKTVKRIECCIAA